jgi:hypothetical protein
MRDMILYTLSNAEAGKAARIPSKVASVNPYWRKCTRSATFPCPKRWMRNYFGRETMRFLASLVLLVILVAGVAWAFGFINLRQTREAQLPTVSVQGGQSPKFDADVAKVDVGTRNETVSVPTVNVEKPAK